MKQTRNTTVRRAATALVALGMVLLAAAGGAAAADRVALERLRCEYEADPVGIEVVRPRLSWQMRSSARGQRQTAYQVLVASSEAGLKQNRGDLWDSGKVVSDQSVHVTYAGSPGRSGQRCFWKVRVWDRDDRASGYSRPAFWEMGLLVPTDWKARWITVEPEGAEAEGFGGAAWIWFPEGDAPPAGERFFRRTFELPAGANVKGTRLNITADDQFVLFVNGVEVGKSSGATDAWKQPMAFDVARHLKPGTNVIAVAARNTASGPAGLLARLTVALEGREPLTILTDGAWQAGQTAGGDWKTTAAAPGAPWQAARQVAKLGSGPWGAVGGGGVGPARYLRRTFAAAKPIKQARLYATALGIYEPYLNGKRVGDHVFAPGWTEYRKRVHYQTYDVTRLLRRGENALGMILADGWYAGYVGLTGRGVYGNLPLALCQLRIDYTDGTSETVATDTSWRGAVAGPIVRADLLMGETYDARREMPGWDGPGFDDSKWRPVVVGEASVPREAQIGPPVRRTEELKPRLRTQPAAGAWVFDLGQNMVGWARLKVRGAPGTKVTLRFAEMLNPDGTLYTANYRSARCIDEYVLRGGGKDEVYEPRFTFRGFRYVEVSGFPGTPNTDAVTGVVLHSDTPRVGRMETSSPMVNQLLRNIDWGQRGNFLSVPTDCPQRDERLGWTGDAQVFIRTATYNRDVASFFTKWLQDLEDSQSPAGAFPDVAPRINVVGEGTAAWGDAGVICPWTQYVVYGDTRLLETRYPSMVRWVEYCRANSKDLLRPAAGYGDWLSINANTPKDVLATAYFAYSTRLVAKAAKALGKTADAAKYEDLFQQIKTAFNKAYVAADGRIKGNTQTVYVLALHFDLLPDDKREAAERHLVADIQGRKGHLSTGFVGVSYLNPTLTRTGNHDLAYRLLNNDTFPSWGYSIKHGATTIWERWDGWTAEKGFQDPGMNSFNHYSLGAVGEWLFSTVAGIDTDPDRVGFKHVLVRPLPGGGITHSKAEYESLYGRIATEWKDANGRYTLDVTIPANTRATVWVPAADGTPVTEGGKPVEQSEGVLLLRREAGSAVYSVGSGTYRFASTKPAVQPQRSAATR